MRLVGYTRVSSESQSDNSSLAEQQKKIEAYCCAFGHDLISVYQEVGSGKSIDSRSQFQAALAQVKDEADGIIAAKSDSLGLPFDMLSFVHSPRGS
jgi:DNA invertase Pin-like site-specific DNA recombinase